MKKTIIFTILFVLNFQVYSLNYECPKLPITVKIGDSINNDWLIWPLNEKINYWSKAYYFFWNKKYEFKYWTAFPTGQRTGIKKTPKHYIGCCYFIKEEKRRICAFKNVVESKCSPIFNRSGPINFTCEKKHIS